MHHENQVALQKSISNRQGGMLGAIAKEAGLSSPKPEIEALLDRLQEAVEALARERSELQERLGPVTSPAPVGSDMTAGCGGSSPVGARLADMVNRVNSISQALLEMRQSLAI